MGEMLSVKNINVYYGSIHGHAWTFRSMSMRARSSR